MHFLLEQDFISVFQFRWKLLQLAVDERYKLLSDYGRDGGLGLLTASVESPWERATTANKVPYYIKSVSLSVHGIFLSNFYSLLYKFVYSHEQESTHWDHPKMLELMSSLSELNEIKFSAYRTAMKLRAVQKKLCCMSNHLFNFFQITFIFPFKMSTFFLYFAVDSIPLAAALEAFDNHGLRAQNDKLLDVPDMVTVLRSMYEKSTEKSERLNLPLVLDLAVNWLLNVYDSQRTGQIRVLSFKVGIVLLCKGHLEEKYRCMYPIIMYNLVVTMF